MAAEPIPSLPLRAVVFDLGKVLVDFDYHRSASRIAAHSSLPAAEVQWFMHQSPLLCRYESGEITTEEFFKEVAGNTGFRGTLAEFNEFFSDVFWPIPEMIRVKDQLRKQGLSCHIFSNTNELAIGHIRKNFPFFSQFDGYVLSYEHGVMKPDRRLYEVVERVTGLKGSALLYLDDLAENIDSGRQRGWQTIHHQSTQKTVLALEEMGLLLRA